MGIVRTIESRKAELEEFRRVLLEHAGVRRRKEFQEEGQTKDASKMGEEAGEEKTVCVTSGISFLGLAIVSRLLDRGYSVRIIVDNEEELQKLRETEMFGEMTETNSNGRRIWAVMAKITDAESLCEAFRDCRGVFHTSAFVDPVGLSGYSKVMADLEARASESVMEACAMTPSVRKCVLTSSLVSCIWRDNSLHNLSAVVDHSCWSDESLCRDKKLWYALGKTMAEKAAWRVAEASDQVKLLTICPGLLTGPEFYFKNLTSSIAFLKGGREMFADGLLAIVDVRRVAQAHVCVYEAASSAASGRYICFDRVIETEEDAADLAGQMEMPSDRITGTAPPTAAGESLARFELCNRKLSRLMSAPSRCFSHV